MGNVMRKTLLIIFVASLAWFTSFAQETETTVSIDSATYSLYQQGKWKEVTVLSRSALRQGIDYFYLRLRCGLSYYFLGKYAHAEMHLAEALKFNPADRIASEYLYYAFQMQNKEMQAMSLLKKMPASLSKQLKENEPPEANLVHLDIGIFLSDQGDVFRERDLDGPGNYYGEADIFNRARYFSAGARWVSSSNLSFYAAYTYLDVDKNKLVMTENKILLDDPYRVKQHQFYLNSVLQPFSGFSITPAFHFITLSLDPSTIRYDIQDDSYQISDTAFGLNNFIVSLSLMKDYRIIHAGISGAVANLNDRRQFQAGFDLAAFPLGNLDLYAQGHLLVHIDAGEMQPVAGITAGGRILRPVWLELSGTFGRVSNYFEKNASAVYNFTDVIRFRYGARVIATLSSRWLLSVDYQYIGKQADYISYNENGQGGNPAISPNWHPLNYTDHFLTGSILWKF